MVYYVFMEYFGHLTDGHSGRNESFTFRTGSTAPKLTASVFDHKTIAKDKLLGEVDIDVSLLSCATRHVKVDIQSSRLRSM